ncbi:MAG TPA: TIGR00730 family Rossman fold protein [Xanthobacteraceae bacterium]
MTDNASQRRSKAYRLAVLDPDFLLGDSLRGVRLLLEFTKAEERLRQWGIHSTVVVFGSARNERPPPGAGRAVGAPMPAVARHDWWYEEARRFAAIVSQRGGAMRSRGMRENVIATGGGPGLMEAANRGAFEAGAPSIGFNIDLPEEQEPNPYTTPELTFRFHSFAIRKMHLAMRASALVAFPGGFGTLDELFEILTLVQAKKMPPVAIVCFDRSYWTRVINFDALIDAGMISRSDFELLTFADDAEEAWEALVTRGLRTRASATHPKRRLSDRADV